MTAPFGTTDLLRLRAAHPEVRVIDVRTPGEFAHRHIPGSTNIPLPDLAEHRRELAGVQVPTVLVCESGRRAARAETELASAGFDAVHVLAGGVAAWVASGQPVARHHGSGSWTLDRQVRLATGAIVAAAAVAGLAWPPAVLLAGAMGAGLVLASITDTCAMGAVLARLPGNRRRGCDLPTVVHELITNPEARS